MQACLDTSPDGATVDAFAVATEIWATMHGLVDLPFGNPTFPWPDPVATADAWLARFRASLHPGATADQTAG